MQVKRKLNITFLVFIILLLVTVNVSSQVITPKEAIEDLEHMVMRMEEVHPNLYFHLSKDKAQSKMEDIKAALRTKQEWSSIEIYRLFAPFTASFKDGHTGVYIGDKFREYYDEGGQIFPFDIKFIDDKVLIDKNYSQQELTFNTEILAINDIEIDKIIDKIKDSISSENSIYAYAMMERQFPVYLWAHFDFDGEYKLTLKDSIKGKYKITIDGITKETRINAKEKNDSENWMLDFPREDSAYLTINTFNGRLKNSFERDIEKYFKEINKRDIQYLFIDISENGGGNTDLAKFLYEYFNDQPYSLFKEVRMKYSEYAFRNQTSFFTNLYYSFKKDRDNMIVFQSDQVKPKDNDLRFNGKVYVITSNFTFSTATDFAAIVKDHNTGNIVGEETGGLASCYGDVIRDKLPNSELSFGVSYKYFLRPAGFDNGRGVQPDIELDIGKLKYSYDREGYQNMVIKSIIY
mgnify:FL=1